MPGRVAQSVGHLTRKSGSWVRYPVWQHTFVSPSSFSRRAVVSYRRKCVHEVLVNRLGGLSLPRKSVVRLTDRPDMTLDVYRGRKTTMQQATSVLIWLQISIARVLLFGNTEFSAQNNKVTILGLSSKKKKKKHLGLPLVSAVEIQVRIVNGI